MIEPSAIDDQGFIWPLRCTHTATIQLGLFMVIGKQCQEYPDFARLHNAGMIRSRKARMKAPKLVDQDWPALPY